MTKYSELKHKLKSEWKIYYVDVLYLKKEIAAIKQSLQYGKITKQDAERNFTNLVELELRKVNEFYLMGNNEIKEKLASLRKLLNQELIKTEAKIHDLQEFIKLLSTKITELNEYTIVNYEAFRKIMKHHDKVMDSVSTPWFMARCKQQPFYCSSQQFGNLLVQFSNCCTNARALMGNKEEAKTVTAGGLQNFQRNTSKYWVKKEDIMRVKTIVTENLPINIFTSDSSRFLQEPTDSAFISSVYYDNPNTMELYEGRLRKSQGAIAVRFRKYEHGEEIFVERKTHHESWITGSSSIKERFDLDPSDVYNFVRGTYKSDDFTKRLETQGKSEKAIKEAVKLFEEIQQAIILRHLVPCVTTACDRTAFQIPGDAKVRISLDIDLHMIKESLKLKNDGKWCKDQFQISEEDIHNFPYAILEVKLQTHEGVEPPLWVRDLVNGPLVRQAHKYSKFIHGAAMLVPELVPCWPVWIYEFTDTDKKSEIPDEYLFGGTIDIAPAENMIELDDLTRERMDKFFTLPQSNSPASILTRIMNYFDFEKRLSLERGPLVMNRDKIEPKSYFANERTFLHVFNFCIVIQGIGFSLLNFQIFGALFGLLFILISLGLMSYTFYQFRWRAACIRTAKKERYDDIYAPIAIFSTLTFVVFVNTCFVASSKYTTKEMYY